MRKNRNQFLNASTALVAFIAFFMMSCQDQEQAISLTTPELVQTLGEKDLILGKYIVVLNENSTNFRKTDDYQTTKSGMRIAASAIMASAGIESSNIDHVYGNIFPGFSAELSSEELNILERDPRVKYIEPDGYVYASVTQSNATWGLDRIDQTALPLNGTYTYNSTGQNVTAYIIDTGIKTAHNEFGGRAFQGYDAFGGNSEDCNGHGTHVAGTVGGSVYGVAKGVKLVGVRVLDCNGSGSFSGVIAGMDWVVANASGPSVANMSLGGGASTAVDDAVGRMFDAGVPVIVAAGNGDSRGRQQPACNYSPARAPKAYTVGATTNTDSKTSWSNYGDCVDIFAPGASITAAWHTSNTATNTISGTSMASPHVAGVAALYLESNPTASSQSVYDFISTTSTKNIVTNSSTAKNHLLYSLGTSSGGGGTDPDPDPDPSGINLSATGTKVQGRWKTDLTWTGVTTTQVDIYRNGAKIATVDNTGSYSDQTTFRGGGSLTYKVCNAASTTTCSSNVTVQF